MGGSGTCRGMGWKRDVEGRKLMQKQEGRGSGFTEVNDMCLESGT